MRQNLITGILALGSLRGINYFSPRTLNCSGGIWGSCFPLVLTSHWRVIRSYLVSVLIGESILLMIVLRKSFVRIIAPLLMKRESNAVSTIAENKQTSGHVGKSQHDRENFPHRFSSHLCVFIETTKRGAKCEKELLSTLERGFQMDHPAWAFRYPCGVNFLFLSITHVGVFDGHHLFCSVLCFVLFWWLHLTEGRLFQSFLDQLGNKSHRNVDRSSSHTHSRTLKFIVSFWFP